MRWCKAVNPCLSWMLISQPVWRKWTLSVSTNASLSESDKSEHVEQWDRRVAGSKGGSVGNWAEFKKVDALVSAFASDGNFRENPPSKQNSNKGLADVRPEKEKQKERWKMSLPLLYYPWNAGKNILSKNFRNLPSKIISILQISLGKWVP